MALPIRKKSLVLALAIAGLDACGGGGGDTLVDSDGPGPDAEGACAHPAYTALAGEWKGVVSAQILSNDNQPAFCHFDLTLVLTLIAQGNNTGQVCTVGGTVSYLPQSTAPVVPGETSAVLGAGCHSLQAPESLLPALVPTIRALANGQPLIGDAQVQLVNPNPLSRTSEPISLYPLELETQETVLFNQQANRLRFKGGDLIKEQP